MIFGLGFLHFRRTHPAEGVGEPSTLFTLRGLKFLGAVLILLGLVLPLYSCRGKFVDTAGREMKYVDAKGAPVAADAVDVRQPLPPGLVPLDPKQPPLPGLTYRKNYHYFFGDFSADEPSDWIRLVGFLWPTAAALGAHRLKRRWSRRVFLGMEPLLLLVTAFSLCIGAMFGTKEVGFWVAWAGVMLYGLAAAWMDVGALAAWTSRWRWPVTILACLAFFGSAVVSVLTFFDGFTK